MTILKKESKIFLSIWINLFIILFIVSLFLPLNPIMNRWIAILYLFGNSILYSTLISGLLMVIYYFITLLRQDKS